MISAWQEIAKLAHVPDDVDQVVATQGNAAQITALEAWADLSILPDYETKMYAAIDAYQRWLAH